MPTPSLRGPIIPIRSSDRARRIVSHALIFLTLMMVLSAVEATPQKRSNSSVSTVGIVSKTHAARHIIAGGFRDSLEFKFVRFLEQQPADVPLTIRYAFEWISALPEDFERGNDLREPQELTFPTPAATDRDRGYQTSIVTLHLQQEQDRASSQRPFHGQQLRISLIASPEGRYHVVDEDGRLVPEWNRRWAEQSALCRIYEGCVVACLPQDRTSLNESNPVDISDLDQFVPDCYFIAALAAAVRRNPNEMRKLITQTPVGFVVTFPGHEPIAVPLDIDRGPDMVDSQALDIDARGYVEIWPILIERAFAVLNSRLKVVNAGVGQEFLDISNGDSQWSYHLLTGRHAVEVTRWDFASRQSLLRAIETHLSQSKPVMMATGKWTHAGDRPHWWLEHHVYLLTTLAPNQKTITVFDPRSGQLFQRIKIGPWLETPEIKRFLFCD